MLKSQALNQNINNYKSDLTNTHVSSIANNKRFRILLAEDGPHMRELLNELLLNEGFDVEKCGDGENLVNKIENSIKNENPYDLIISDVRMPGLSPLEAIDQFSRKTRPPIILMSAFGSETLKQKSKNKGVLHFFDKPFEIDTLLTFIHSFFLEKSQQSLSINSINNTIKKTKSLPFLFYLKIELLNSKPREMYEVYIKEKVQKLIKYADLLRIVGFSMKEISYTGSNKTEILLDIKVNLKSRNQSFELSHQQEFKTTNEIFIAINEKFSNIEKLILK